MPVPTTSRHRLSRRQNSEEIEDARRTQARRPADDVSDDDEPAVRVKKEKKGKKRAVANDDDDDAPDGTAPIDDEDEDEDDRIDVDNFPDQPLSRADLHKLKGISQDWESMANQIGQQHGIYRDVATAMAEAGEPDITSSADLQSLDRDMREFIDVCAEMRLHAKSLDLLYQRVAQEEVVVEPEAIYESGVQTLMEEYSGKTSRQRYLKDPRYSEFQSGIWEVHHPEDPMPPLTEFIPREDGDDSDDEDDLEIGGVTQNYNCPISLTTLVKPVTSRVCNHSFSKASIDGYFVNRGRPQKCPASGCNKTFRYEDCKDDPVLEKKVAKHLRHVATLTSQDSDGEVVD